MDSLRRLKTNEKILQKSVRVASPAPKILFRLEQFIHHFHYLVFAVIVALNCDYELTIFVSCDDTVTRQLRALDIFLALPFANLAGRNFKSLSMLFTLVIHDDRNFIAKHSSVEIVVNQGGLFLPGQSRSHEAKRQNGNEQY